VNTISHSAEITAFGRTFGVCNGDTVEVKRGVLHLNGFSVKDMADRTHYDQARTCANCGQPYLMHVEGLAFVGDPTKPILPPGPGVEGWRRGLWCPGRQDGVQHSWEAKGVMTRG